jgi:hypothetical protein
VERLDPKPLGRAGFSPPFGLCARRAVAPPTSIRRLEVKPLHLE